MVIISPTRELALQIFQVASELMKYHHQTFGIVMGGANRCVPSPRTLVSRDPVLMLTWCVRLGWGADGPRPRSWPRV